MNKGLNAVKNIFWMLTLIVAVIAVLVGTVFAVSRKFYGDRLDGALDIRSEKVTQVKKPSASQAPAGGDGLIELNGTQDAGIEYVLSLTYLCDSTTDVYAAVKALNIGDKIDMEGFLYWYEGVNPHITSVTVK